MPPSTTRVGDDGGVAPHARPDGRSALLCHHEQTKRTKRTEQTERRIGCFECEESFEDPRHRSNPGGSLWLRSIGTSGQKRHLAWIKEDL